MPNRRIQYATIFLTVFVDILGFGIVIPVLPLYAEQFGASPVGIGWLVGIFSLMQFFFAPVWGRLSDRVGRKPVLLIGMLGTVAGYLIMGFAGSFLMLFLARLFSGVAGANISAAQAYLADISSPENRAKAMGLLGAAFGLGFVFGPALGGWASGTFHYSTPMFIAAGLAAINVVFMLVFLPESRTPGLSQSLPRGVSGLFQHVRRGQFLWSVAAYFSVIAGFSIMTTIFALYLLHRFELGVQHTGFILAGIGVLGVLIQGGLIGRLARRFGEPALAVTGAVIMACGLAGLALAGGILPMLAAAAAVGVGNSLIMPSLSSLASRAADADWQGRALGVLQSAGSLARFLGPFTCGLLLAMEAGSSGQIPYGALPLATAAGILIVSVGIAWCLRRAYRTESTA